jgi:hypothetical protein
MLKGLRKAREPEPIFLLTNSRLSIKKKNSPLFKFKKSKKSKGKGI